VIGAHVRRLRSARRLTLRGVAARSGFSASFISQLENGQVSPSLGSLHRIAEALGVSLGEFFASSRAEPTFVVRRGDRRRIESTWTDAQIEALGAMTRDRDLVAVLAVFGPGARSGTRPHAQAGEEFAFVVKGRVTLTLQGEAHDLGPGDAVTLPARALRLWENPGRRAAEVLMVSARSSG
jgi:transcriptional regulator with XRE-family HTH domain